jgi:glycosyltransferase involved in cell wall biosynthesis
VNSEPTLHDAPTPRETQPRVALVHDFLVERGGAERVLLELARAFPQARIHTALFRPDATYEGFAARPVRPLVNDPVGVFSREHRTSLPLAARAFRTAVVDADVTICSSSGLAHLVRTPGIKIVYCHTPARWLHQPEEYFRRLGPLKRIVGNLVGGRIRRPDREAMVSASCVIANSEFTAEEVHDLYGIDAMVLRPASSLSPEGATSPIEGVAPGFFLTPSRLLSYKRLDILLAAASRLPDHRFVVIGDGPLRGSLSRQAPANVTFTGSTDDAVLRWAYRYSRAVVLTSSDDFGLVPGEARAFGRPVVVPDAGGYHEQLLGGLPATAYRYGDAADLAARLCSLPVDLTDTATLDLAGAQAAFRQDITELVEKLLADRPPRGR